MGHFRTFMLGVLTAYGVYHITRKGPDEKSILDKLLEDPVPYLKRLEKGFIIDIARTIKEVIR